MLLKQNSLRESRIAEILEEQFYHIIYTVKLVMNINSWYLTFFL